MIQLRFLRLRPVMPELHGRADQARARSTRYGTQRCPARASSGYRIQTSPADAARARAAVARRRRPPTISVHAPPNAGADDDHVALQEHRARSRPTTASTITSSAGGSPLPNCAQPTCATSAPSPAPTSAMPTKYANTRIDRAEQAADERRDDHPDGVARRPSSSWRSSRRG